MGWADCGNDSKGRNIGYGWTGTCDHPGCAAEIDRGLSYACGGMHGEADLYCERYFCSEHMRMVEPHPLDKPLFSTGLLYCFECASAYEETENGKAALNELAEA